MPVGEAFSVPVQTGRGAHPASCTMGTGSFPGVKVYISKSSPITGLEWLRGFQEVRVPRFHDNGTGWW